MKQTFYHILLYHSLQDTLTSHLESVPQQMQNF